MEAKSIYYKYDTRVQEYMQNVIDCLEQDYGKIPASWRVSLDLIADNYNELLHTFDHQSSSLLTYTLLTCSANVTYDKICYLK